MQKDDVRRFLLCYCENVNLGILFRTLRVSCPQQNEKLKFLLQSKTIPNESESRKLFRLISLQVYIKGFTQCRRIQHLSILAPSRHFIRCNDKLSAFNRGVYSLVITIMILVPKNEIPM